MSNGNFAKYVVLAFFAVGASLMGWNALRSGNDTKAGVIAVKAPELSAAARTGKSAFDANCASCHGQNAAGTDKGPPLIHDIYNPGHHADEAFFLAAKLGVRRHHWRFGDMPPQPQVSEEQMRAVVRYVREVQAANGIAYRPHRM
ncbi:MAG: hypothetical protein BroJett024_17110 [Alphaproteobacteria bacterium]|nr:MAG: hypothetical protein BroJett024_17110 [Alphaproteobacteria bacterium]